MSRKNLWRTVWVGENKESTVFLHSCNFYLEPLGRRGDEELDDFWQKLIDYCLIWSLLIIYALTGNRLLKIS